MVKLGAGNLQRQYCLITGAFRLLLELLLFGVRNAILFGVAIVRILIAADAAREQQYRHHGHGPDRTKRPPRQKLSIGLFYCWLRCAFGFGLVYSCHHPLSKAFARIFALQRFTKIVFRKMHIEPLESCASVPCAGQPASDAACSLRCSPAFPELPQSQEGPNLLETS